MAQVSSKVIAAVQPSHQIFSRGFAKDCPNGKLYRQKVTEVYEEIVPNGNCKFFVDNIFRIFDQDNNGYLDFKVKF